MRTFRDWLPVSVRSRLLSSFWVLFLASVILAVVGLLGLRETDRALDNFRLRVFPEVSLSLELSQRTAAIAANAPYVAESTLPFQLQAEAQAIRLRVAEVETLAAGLPANSTLARDLHALLIKVRANVEELIEVTRRDLFLQEDAREFVYRLDGLRESLPPGSDRTRLQAILLEIALVNQIDSPLALEGLRVRIEGEIQHLDHLSGTADGVRAFVRSAASGDSNVFAARSQHFALVERKSFLVIQARAQAERLGERVEAYVSDLRGDIDAEARAIDHAAYSGLVGIVLITLVCIAAAMLGMRSVNRSLRSLAGITRVMSRLASGDVEQSTPETSRLDELGDLARAFEVFRENAREIRRISTDLQEQSSLMETVFESINDGLSVFDRHGRLVTWNRQYGVLLGLPPAVLVRGATLETIQVLLPAQASGVRQTVPLNGLNASRQHEGLRFDLTFPGGRLIECRSDPMPGGGFVTLYSDLTERRDVESQLRQAQKMEVLGQLTSGVAHDFNNLLTAIIGNAYLLEISEQLSARDRRLAERVSKAADRGATLTARLLAFARRQNLSPQAVEVDGLIEDLADLIEYSIGSAIKLSLDLNARQERVWVDKAQLENALLNLVINARDAMPDGGGLRMETHLDSELDTVRIDVSDTGQGMDEGTLERIFEPFFTTKGLGSGLGLSIVYGFVMQSGGSIVARSDIGRGTTFALSLPLSRAATYPDETASKVTPRALQSQCVLLVEDDPDVRLAVCEMLGAMGHSVLVAESAEEALLLLAEPVSLVISDVDLGGTVNGADLAREVASRADALPCILMSGVPYDVLSSRFRLVEPNLLLAKPFSSPQLEACMRAALGLAETQD